MLYRKFEFLQEFDKLENGVFGKDYKDILKKQVKSYIVSKGYVKESEYKYEITGLENYYVQDGKFHMVFNGESDGITNKTEVIDIVIDNL